MPKAPRLCRGRCGVRSPVPRADRSLRAPCPARREKSFSDRSAAWPWSLGREHTVQAADCGTRKAWQEARQTGQAISGPGLTNTSHFFGIQAALTPHPVIPTFRPTLIDTRASQQSTHNTAASDSRRTPTNRSRKRFRFSAPLGPGPFRGPFLCLHIAGRDSAGYNEKSSAICLPLVSLPCRQRPR